MATLAQNPTVGAHCALEKLRALRFFRRHPEQLEPYIVSPLAAAAEHQAKSWTEDEIVAVEQGDERLPTSRSELFALVLRHLSRVGNLLENDDASYASLFGEKTDEKLIQRWVASSLKLSGRGLYTVERESEVQDEKKSDISVTVPNVGRIPIEMKPLCKRRSTYQKLKGSVSVQLVQRYMRPRDVEYVWFISSRSDREAHLELGLEVRSSGELAAMRALKSENVEPKLLDCILQSANGLAFPAEVGDSRVTYPLHFMPASADASRPVEVIALARTVPRETELPKPCGGKTPQQTNKVQPCPR